MNPRVRFLFLRFWNKVFSLVGISHYYATKTGIKVLNRRDADQNNSNAFYSSVFETESSELFLGVDGLKDKYSFVDARICESPHYDLITHSERGSLDGCEYISRERIGALDGRDTVYYNDSFHFESYKGLKKRVRDDYEPIIVYTIQGTHYIADGKHRAAYLTYMKRPIKCIEARLDNSTLDYMKCIYRLMKKEEASYSKNINLIEKIFADYKEDLS